MSKGGLCGIAMLDGAAANQRQGECARDAHEAARRGEGGPISS